MKKITSFGTALLAAITLALPLFAVPAFAQAPAPAPSDTNQSADGPYVDHTDDPAIKGTRCPNASNCELIKTYVQPAVDFFAAFVGVAVVTAMIYGGIEYSSSGGDPQRAAAGKKRIRNALFALLIFFFFYSLLRFVLLPGSLI